VIAVNRTGLPEAFAIAAAISGWLIEAGPVA